MCINVLESRAHMKIMSNGGLDPFRLERELTFFLNVCHTYMTKATKLMDY